MNHVTKCAEALREKFKITTYSTKRVPMRMKATTEEIEAVIRPFFAQENDQAFSDGVESGRKQERYNRLLGITK